MRRGPGSSARLLLTTLLGVLSLTLPPGCATTGTAPPPAKGAAGAPPEAAGVKASVPSEFPITLVLNEGESWKSRFVSTSEMKRTLKGADGKETVRARSVGLELLSSQKVVSVSGGTARIEVTESSVRILQEGRFIDAPFRQLNPPNPVHFTLDVATGKADFSEMEKAYADWMAAVKAGPAGDILGKTFRADSYVAQLKELYAKPFNRFSGRKISKEPRAAGAKEFVLPFLGPGVALGPVPVEATSWYEGFDARGGAHLLKVAGRYAGDVTLSPEEMNDRFADFAVPVPAAWKSSGEARGEYTSSVDVISGREVRSVSQLRYSVAASFEGGTFSEEITGKSMLDPAD